MQSKISVVGQEQESASIYIQTPYRIDAQFAHPGGKQVENSGAALWVVGCADVAYWFVEQEIYAFTACLYKGTIDGYPILNGVDVGTRGGYGEAIDLYPTRRNQALG